MPVYNLTIIAFLCATSQNQHHCSQGDADANGTSGWQRPSASAMGQAAGHSFRLLGSVAAAGGG